MRTISISLLLLLFIDLYSQNKFNITGRVLDSSTDQPIEYASVVIKGVNKPNDTKALYTDTLGFYSIRKIESGKYILNVNFLGYKKFVSDTFLIDTLAKFHYNDIKLELDATQISTVEVNSKRTNNKVYVSKNVFIVSSDILKNSKNTYDLLRQVPGVNVDFNKLVTIEGSSNIIILIDGIEPANKNLINHLSPEDIEKVEVVNNPSARYTASGYRGVLNIITKKEKKKGLKGSLNIEDSHKLNFNSSYANIDYGYKKSSSFVYYQYYFRGMNESNIDNRKFYLNQMQNISLQSNVDPQRIFDNELYYGSDYYLTSKQKIGISGYASFYTENITNSTLEIQNLQTSQQKLYEKMNSYDYGAYYKLDFDKEDHNLLIETNYTRLNVNDDISINYDEPSNILAKQIEKRYKDVYSVKINYAVPLNNQSLELGMHDSHSFLNGDFSDQSVTNKFNYKDYKLSAYANISGSIFSLDSIGYQVGFNFNIYDRVADNFKNTFYRYLPNMSILKNINSKNTIKVSFTSLLSFPNIWNLDPSLIKVDKYSIKSGNPDLYPVTSYNFDINYSYSYKYIYFSIKPYYSIIKNNIESVYQPISEDSIVKLTYENISNINKLGIYSNTSINIFKWWKLIFDLDLFNKKMLENTYGFKGNLNTFSATISTLINIGKNWTIGSQYSYKTYELSYFGKYKSPSLCLVYIDKKLLKKTSSISLMALEPIGDYKTISYINNSYYNIYHENKINLSLLILSFKTNLSFGKELKDSERTKISTDDAKH